MGVPAISYVCLVMVALRNAVRLRLHLKRDKDPSPKRHRDCYTPIRACLGLVTLDRNAYLPNVAA